MMNRKAISRMISVIILTVVVVAASLGVAAWLGAFTPAQLVRRQQSSPTISKYTLGEEIYAETYIYYFGGITYDGEYELHISAAISGGYLVNPMVFGPISRGDTFTIEGQNFTIVNFSSGGDWITLEKGNPLPSPLT